MAEGLTIRAARRDEIADVLALWRAADAVPSVGEDVDGVTRLLDRDPGCLLLAAQGARILGTLIAAWDGWRASMYRLAVAPEARRRGIALALVRAGEERVVALGARKLAAMVLHEHDHATAFWRAAGYEHDARLLRFTRTMP